MAKASFIFLILAMTAVFAQAQNKTDIRATLEKNGFKSAVVLLDAANMTSVLDDPLAYYTILVPSDAAITQFLNKMGLTVADLKARPMLAKQLVAAHIISKANVRPQELFANSSTRIVKTLARKPNSLVFRKGPNGAVTVTDVQGGTANVKAAISIDGRKTIHPIDKVMLPESVFYSWAHLCSFRTLTLSEFCNALAYADLNSTVESKDFKNTVFVPNNKAFAKILELDGGKVPSVNRTQEVLTYHVVPGIHELPKGFKSGESTATLAKGKNLTIDYEVVKPAAGGSRKLPYTVASVVPASGEKIPVVKANVYVGGSVVHGIEDMLIPDAKPKAATAKPAAATAGRRLFSGLFEASRTRSRSLLQFGWGMSAGPTAEMDAAQGAIEAAADGYETPFDAADESLHGAEDLSVPGAYNLVDEGITPW